MSPVTMDELDPTVVGDHASIHLRPEVERLRLYVDELHDHLEFVLSLATDTWEQREVVIDKMIQLQDYYGEHYSIGYSFGAIDQDGTQRSAYCTPSAQPVFAR